MKVNEVLKVSAALLTSGAAIFGAWKIKNAADLAEDTHEMARQLYDAKFGPKV